VFLIGMMGAGKSTVAGLLAARLGWSVVDTDEVVEARAGMSVAEIFSRGGEAAFRQEEERALAEVGVSPGPLVVSVGGGAVLSATNRSVLQRAGTVVWLRAKAATLAARVGDGAGRPLLAGRGQAGVTRAGEPSGGGPREALERLVAERQRFYEEVANAIVDVDDCSPHETAQCVLAALGARSGDVVAKSPCGGPLLPHT
jgi:shikimate kinase